MERRIDLHFRVSYEPRVVRPWLALCLLLLSAGELGSENVTLTTYYPAPSGMYTQMVVTGNTWLARDSGNTAVGGAGPATEKLHVFGNEIVTGNASVGVDLSVGQNATVANDLTVVNNALVRNSVGINLGFGIPGARLDVAGNARVSQNIAIAGAAPGIRPYVYVNASGNACATLAVNGAPTVVCPGGYVTWVPGLYVDGFWWFTGPSVNLSSVGGASPTANVLSTSPTYYCCTK